MAVAGGTQAVIAAFSFGLVALAATGIAVLFTFGGHHLRTKAPSRNELRLVLLIFLLSSTLWSIVGFASALITSDGNAACQALIVFSAAFDELSRVAFEQFLLWRIKTKKPSSGIFVLQSLIFVRFIMGCVLIGVQRPQIDPVCIARNILLPLGIVILVADILIVCILLVLIQVVASSKELSTKQKASLALTKTSFLTASFGAWLATSIPMIIGVEMFPPATRTVLPAVGLLLLLGLIVLFRTCLITTEPTQSTSSFYPGKANTSKALPNRPAERRPVESRETYSSPEFFNRPWGDQRLHVAQLQKLNTEPSPKPQTSSREAASALPTINRPTPGQTEKGIGGLPVQGQLFPPIRANTAPVILQKPPKKRPKHGWPSISNPVIRQSSGLKISETILTIDLSTAARNDQERRARAAGSGLQRQSAVRDVPTRQNSFSRQEISDTAMPAISTQGSYLAPGAATTAAQISPTADQLRRRSPRSSSAPNTSTAVISPPPKSPRRPSYPKLSQTREGAPSLPTQHPLRRSRAPKSVLHDSSGVFIDPNTPPAIPMALRGVNTSWSSPNSAEGPLVPRVKPLPMSFSSTRPDAAPAKSYQSVAAANAQASVLPRSSTGSVRRDIRPSHQRPASNEKLAAPAKTPVQLRAVNGIPLNPRSNQKKKAIMFANKPNGNDEVGSGLLGAPTSRQILALSLADSSRPTESIVHRPRPIPRKSSIYKADFTIKISPTVFRHRLSRQGGSIELQRQSVDSGSEPISRIPSFPNPPTSTSAVLVALGKLQDLSGDMSKPEIRGSVKPSSASSAKVGGFADSTPSNPAGTSPETALPKSAEFGGGTSIEPASAYNIRRQSSPVLPAEEMRHVSMAHPGPRSPESKTSILRPRSARSDTSTTSQHDDDGKETVPLVLDTGAEGPANARSPVVQMARWHRRVGDACPTFSDRKTFLNSPRRVLAPAPLLLSRSTRRTRIVEAPASPLESPQHALAVIQQQLKRLDGADSETRVEDKQLAALLENIEAEMGAQESHWQDIRRNLSNRSSMSQLSSGGLNLTSPQSSPVLRSHDRDLAVLDRGLAPASDPENHTKTPADKNYATPQSELTRRGRSEFVFTGDGSAHPSAGAVENRAQFGKPAPQNKGGTDILFTINSISAHRRISSQIGSPTPPETDESDDEAYEDVEFVLATSQKINSGSSAVPVSAHSPSVEKTPLPLSHWSIDSEASLLDSATLQRAKYLSQRSNSISSTVSRPSAVLENFGGLKSPSETYETRSPISPRHGSLVSPVTSDQIQTPRRPVTQKPPRRSKRITLLPDIPESPKPLKHKRDTLGIFQFPWGETSDIATLQPQQSAVFAVPLPGAAWNQISTSQPFLASQEHLLASEGYPSSFFDPYDDDDDDDDEAIEAPAPDSDNSEEEDEAFDETTLWEIANLLRTTDIPSRYSLFTAPEDYRPPSRDGLVSAGETTVVAARNLSAAELEESTLGTEEELLSSPSLSTTSWEADTMFVTTTKGAGLVQPDERTWKRYLGIQAQTLRAAPRKSSEPDRISSTSLWTPPPEEAKKTAAAAEPSTPGLWEPAKKVSTTPALSIVSTPSLVPFSPEESSSSVLTASSTTAASTDQQSPRLWSPVAPVVRVFLGLPQHEEEWSRYTSIKVKSSRPKPGPSAQDAIQSAALWASISPTLASTKPAAFFSFPVTPSSVSKLWSKMAPLPAEQADGLWSPSHIRQAYRTTDRRPAALDTVRKLRIDVRPLATLHSASLWSPTTQMPPPQVPDWLALSTTLRSVSPGGSSALSDDHQDYATSSTTFDTYSLRSEVTAASSVFTSKQQQQHSVSHRKTPSKQAAQEELVSVVRPITQQAKPAVVVPTALAGEPK